MLLKADADKNSQGWLGLTPLTLATSMGHVEIVRLLGAAKDVKLWLWAGSAGLGWEP